MGHSHRLIMFHRHLQQLVRTVITVHIQWGYYKIYFIVEWSKDASPVVVTPCSEQAGPRVQLPSDPLGLFSLFFDDTLVDLIVEETNRYAEQTLQGTDKEWSTDAAEIRAYIGFMILMGDQPPTRDSWLLGLLVYERVPALHTHCRPNFSRHVQADHSLPPLHGRLSPVERRGRLLPATEDGSSHQPPQG